VDEGVTGLVGDEEGRWRILEAHQPFGAFTRNPDWSILVTNPFSPVMTFEFNRYLCNVLGVNEFFLFANGANNFIHQIRV
jgi:hypothetical protein